MTQIKFYAPVKEMNGEFEKGSGIIMRKKIWRLRLSIQAKFLTKNSQP